jgi:hypothetical protein
VKVAIEKGTNGYADKNKMLVALAPNSKEYIGANTPQMQQPVGQPQTTQPNVAQPQVQQTANNTVPNWAKQ